MSSLFYFFKESLTGFTRNLGTTLGSIVTIFLSLLIIGVFLVCGAVVNNIVSSIEDKVSITVYIADEAAQTDIDSLMSDISGMEGVQSVDFTTKEEALENFRNSMVSNPDIVDQLDGVNPLPASILVQLSEAQEVEVIAQQIQSDSTFLKICDNPEDPSDSLKYGQSTVDKLFSLTNYIRYIGIRVHQQHHPPGNPRPSQGDCHHAPGGRLQWLHSRALPDGKRPACHYRCRSGRLVA